MRSIFVPELTGGLDGRRPFSTIQIGGASCIDTGLLVPARRSPSCPTSLFLRGSGSAKYAVCGTRLDANKIPIHDPLPHGNFEVKGTNEICFEKYEQKEVVIFLMTRCNSNQYWLTLLCIGQFMVL